MTHQMIIWRRLDQPGHEAARLWFDDTSWHLAGTAVFAHEQKPCLLEYHLICERDWRTRSGRVAGWLGNHSVEIELSVDTTRRWTMNGREIPAVAGCIDLDLNFSPSTNLLPIRRLGLAVEQTALVKAAWLRFPSFTLEPLDQVYRRLSVETYWYESAGGEFVRELTVNPAGFVTSYPDLWALEADLE